jgi:LPXTG-motif cell wall-anchored protein
MRTRRQRIAGLLVAALLALPAPAWAQSAGDEQYQDPFGGDDQSQSGGSDTSGSSEAAQATPTPTPAPTAPPSSTATTAQAQPAAPQLPRTGGDSAPQLAAGALLLAGGLVLRLRLRPR